MVFDEELQREVNDIYAEVMLNRVEPHQIQDPLQRIILTFQNNRVLEPNEIRTLVRAVTLYSFFIEELPKGTLAINDIEEMLFDTKKRFQTERQNEYMYFDPNILDNSSPRGYIAEEMARKGKMCLLRTGLFPIQNTATSSFNNRQIEWAGIYAFQTAASQATMPELQEKYLELSQNFRKYMTGLQNLKKFILN